MNAELNNDTNNNNTVEQPQNQNGATPATAHNQPEPALTSTDPTDRSASSDPLQTSLHETPGFHATGSTEPEPLDVGSRIGSPTTGNGHLATDQPPNNPEIHESTNPAPEPTHPALGPAAATDDHERAGSQPNSSLCTENSSLQEPRQQRAKRPRVGKVAKLPEELRNYVNEQILRNIGYDHIKHVLREKGYPGISAANISRWKTGGFREWIFSQESAMAQQARREEALKLAREKGADLEEATIHLAMARYHSFFAKVDLAAMEPQLADNPEHLIGVIRGLSHLITANRALKQKQANNLHLKSPAPSVNSSVRPESKGGLTEHERDRVADRLGV